MKKKHAIILLVVNIFYMLCIWFVCGNDYPSQPARFLIVILAAYVNALTLYLITSLDS